jgi:microcystin-dependent protein
VAFLGEIRMFGGNFAPLGWAFCDGQLVPIAENDQLFTLIGTTYGGDGEQTFALPDLRGRLPIHQGTGPGLSTFVMGENGGAEEVTLTVNQIPAHSHAPIAVGGAVGSQIDPAGNLPAQSFNVTPYINDAPTGNFNSAAIAPAGGSQPHTNLQPYLCIRFIIAVSGDFPTQT